MIRTISCSTGLLALLAFTPAAQAQTTTPTPDFNEVYSLVRDHLAGLNAGELNKAAVQGLLNSLGPQVTLVPSSASTNNPAQKPLVTKSSRLEGTLAYVRVGRVDNGLAAAVRQACDKLAATNNLQGLVLDLRYTGGTDYAAAASTADLFLSKERPLLDWGKGVVRSTQKENSLKLPLIVLVNQQTAGAAEALAAAVRESGAGLILGHKTAGQALIAQEFPLRDGQLLRIATGPVRLGDGSALPSAGLQPDITVEVSPKDERAYYANAFQPLSGTNGAGAGALSASNQLGATNPVVRRPRFNEAELVRERKEGIPTDVDLAAATGAAADEPPTVQDPALARALDLLKGLAVVRHSRS